MKIEVSKKCYKESTLLEPNRSTKLGLFLSDIDLEFHLAQQTRRCQDLKHDKQLRLELCKRILTKS